MSALPFRRAAIVWLASILCLLGVAACGSGGSDSLATPTASTGNLVHARCPADQPNVGDVRDANRGIAGLQGTLVPRGAIHLRLCRYYGLESPPGDVGLAVSRTISDPKTIASLTRTLDASAVPVGAEQTCPEDTGATAIGFFLYAHSRPVRREAEVWATG